MTHVVFFLQCHSDSLKVLISNQTLISTSFSPISSYLDCQSCLLSASYFQLTLPQPSLSQCRQNMFRKARDIIILPPNLPWLPPFQEQSCLLELGHQTSPTRPTLPAAHLASLSGRVTMGCCLIPRSRKIFPFSLFPLFGMLLSICTVKFYPF